MIDVHLLRYSLQLAKCDRTATVIDALVFTAKCKNDIFVREKRNSLDSRARADWYEGA
jgi:hypothetical protein